MSETPQIYRRLPGVARKSMVVYAQTFRLWLGEDHLLLARLDGFVEHYKRFAFSDIQALVVQKTAKGRITTIVLLVLAAWPLILALLGSLTMDWNDEGWITCGVLTGFFLAGGVISFLRGPTCRCFLQTAVQQEELPSLNRLRKARKVIQILKPHIEKAQGTILPEEVPARFEEWRLKPNTMPALRQESGGWHKGLFYLWIISGLVSLIEIPLEKIISDSYTLPVDMLLLAGIILAVVMALSRQKGSDLDRGLKRYTIGSVSAFFVLGLMALSYGILLGVSGKGEDLESSPFFQFIIIMDALVSLILGGWGLLKLVQIRKNPKAETVSF